MMSVLKRSAAVRSMIGLVLRTEDWVFDQRFGVKTMMGRRPSKRDPINHYYEPTRAGRMKEMLGCLDIDYSCYSFIDFGSGKGRVLLVAAELPFLRVDGVELDGKLHALAVSNLKSCRGLRIAAKRVSSIHMNALDYVLPRTPLVLYFFNPFGPAVMEGVLRNLETSLEADPREVFVIMLNPEYGYLVDSIPFLKLTEANGRYRIYRTKSVKAAAAFASV